MRTILRVEEGAASPAREGDRVAPTLAVTNAWPSLEGPERPFRRSHRCTDEQLPTVPIGYSLRGWGLILQCFVCWTLTMHETKDDLKTLQEILDRSHSGAGSHLREVITSDRRMTAEEVCGRLTGMRLVALATVTSDNRPLVGPVDGIFYRGAFHFGSSPDSLRVNHVRHRPSVSATHLPGEELAVTVHGRASILDMRSDDNAALRKTVLDIYTPRYGGEWEVFFDSNLYMRIYPIRMFTFRMA